MYRVVYIRICLVVYTPGCVYRVYALTSCCIHVYRVMYTHLPRGVYTFIVLCIRVYLVAKLPPPVATWLGSRHGGPPLPLTRPSPPVSQGTCLDPPSPPPATLAPSPTHRWAESRRPHSSPVTPFASPSAPSPHSSPLAQSAPFQLPRPSSPPESPGIPDA